MGAQPTFRLLWSRISLVDLPFSKETFGISLPKKKKRAHKVVWCSSVFASIAPSTYKKCRLSKVYANEARSKAKRNMAKGGLEEVVEEVVEEAEEAKQEVEVEEAEVVICDWCMEEAVVEFKVDGVSACSKYCHVTCLKFGGGEESETDSGVPLEPNGGLPSNTFGSTLSSKQPRSLFGREILPTSPSTSTMSLGEFVDLLGILFDNEWTEGSTSPMGSHVDLGSLRHLTLDDRKALHAHLYERVAATESLVLVQALRKEVTDWSADGREYNDSGATILIGMAKKNFTWWARMYLSDLRSNTTLKSNKKSQLIMGAPRPVDSMVLYHKHQQQRLIKQSAQRDGAFDRR
jgi:hypothetical protein